MSLSIFIGFIQLNTIKRIIRVNERNSIDTTHDYNKTHGMYVDTNCLVSLRKVWSLAKIAQLASRQSTIQLILSRLTLAGLKHHVNPSTTTQGHSSGRLLCLRNIRGFGSKAFLIQGNVGNFRFLFFFDSSKNIVRKFTFLSFIQNHEDLSIFFLY